MLLLGLVRARKASTEVETIDKVDLWDLRSYSEALMLVQEEVPNVRHGNDENSVGLEWMADVRGYGHSRRYY